MRLFSVVIAGLLAGCDPTTQLVVLVGSDLNVPSELDRVAASVLLLGEPRWLHSFELEQGGDVPFSFGVEPISDRSETRFEILLEGLDPAGQPRVTRRALTWLLDGEALLLPMFLASRCLDEPPCAADETCTEAGCAPAEIDPHGLPRTRPGEELSYDFGIAPRMLDTVITLGPPLVTNTSTATFTFEARGPEVSGFECAAGDEAFVPCTSPFVLQPEDDGDHRFAVRALGADGSIDDTPAEWSWVLDTVPPLTKLSIAPLPRTDDRLARFEFGADETVTFECALDLEEWAPCTSPFERPNLPRGEHTFRIRATDPASNVEEVELAHAWTIYTFVGGELFGSETWSQDGSPFAIQSAVRIPVGFTLTIEAGVRVDAGVADDIGVYGGTLNAIGTRERPILFRDVRMTRRSPVSLAVGTIRVEFADIERGGVSAPTGNAYDRVVLRDSILRRTSRLELAYPGGTSTIERNVFDVCGGIDIATSDGNAIIRNNVFIDPSTEYAVRVADSANDVQKVIVEHNSFTNTAQVNLRIAGTAARVDAANNFWNTSDVAVIGQMIWDQQDTADVTHLVVFEPFLASPHEGTPSP